ncbi:MAG: hypothetical protein B7Z83_05380 [Thiomonas sp. 20-64-5]|nr:MAG: hypothetical protein B7Z83_05380 [Thiomonas sp. 20-64-5]
MSSTEQQPNPLAQPGLGVRHVTLPLEVKASRAPLLVAEDHAAMRALSWARIAFGVFFAINLGLHFNPQYAAQFAAEVSRAAQAAGQPHWLGVWAAGVLQVMAAVGMGKAVALLFGIEALLTVGLLVGWAFPALAWSGLVYELFLWSTLGGLGGPYTSGATDPGTAIVYALGFGLLLLLRGWQGAAWSDAALRRPDRLRVRWAFWLFGLLWAFDAWWKWQPGFLQHFSSLLIGAQAGQPSWIAEWIAVFIGLGHVMGMEHFAVLAALTESAIAAGLLLAPWLPDVLRRLVLWCGLIYSLLLWSTAEGFGGPYGPGFTGNKGDVLGTTTVYALLFLFLLASQGWLRGASPQEDATATLQG